MARAACTFEGCANPRHARGYCSTHLRRIRLYGDPSVVRIPRGDDEARFLAKVDKEGGLPPGRPDLGPCWLWTAHTNAKGYGAFGVRDLLVPAHRWSYEHFVGPIAEGLQVDHLCRRTSCVRPTHLEAVTPRVNTQRARNAMRDRTHCKRGHLLDDANTYRLTKGGRQCRRCTRDRARLHRVNGGVGNDIIRYDAALAVAERHPDEFEAEIAHQLDLRRSRAAA